MAAAKVHDWLDNQSEFQARYLHKLLQQYFKDVIIMEGNRFLALFPNSGNPTAPNPSGRVKICMKLVRPTGGGTADGR